MWIKLRNIFSEYVSVVRSEFKQRWKNYFYQCFLAVVVLIIVMIVLNMEHVVIIASIGATAFIVFLTPGNVTASPRRVTGGHIIGLISGYLVTLIPSNLAIPHVVIYAIAVGLSALLMVALDFEHPPASGTALGVAIAGFTPDVFIAVITSSIILSIAHRLLRKYLRDLT